MGYAYGPRGLCCDRCGEDGSARKRPCPHKVTREAYTLPYCPAPALCSTCFAELGGSRGVHGDRCRDGAAAMQLEEDERAARLAAGDWRIAARYGDWHEQVPEGWIGVTYRRGDRERHALVLKGSADARADWWSELKHREPWFGPTGEPWPIAATS